MEQALYKIGEVSARLNLVDKNSNTLRGWAEEFGEFLSASANAAPGQPRRFTERDIQILTAVRDYRANHYSYDEIRERLRAGEHDVTPPRLEEQAGQDHDTPFAANGQALVPMAQVERLLAPLAASVEEWRRLAEEYRGRLEAREARVEALEQRIEDLYARLDVRASDVVAASAETPVANTDLSSLDANLSMPGIAGIDEASHPDVPTANGHGAAQAEADSDGARLFPLPVVRRAVLAEETVPRAEAPRRRWWRVWG